MAVEFIKDEKDKQREYDPLAVQNKQDGMRYRWIRKDRLNMDRRQWEGWEVCKDGKEASTLLAESGEMRKASDVDKTINIGDLVLAKMPEDRFQERLAAPNRERIKHMNGAVGSSFRAGIKKASGEDLSFEEHKENSTMRSDEREGKK